MAGVASTLIFLGSIPRSTNQLLRKVRIGLKSRVHPDGLLHIEVVGELWPSMFAVKSAWFGNLQ